MAIVALFLNKPGPAQVGAISKAQKLQKDFQVSIYSTRKSKNQKNGPSGVPGSAGASPWCAKRGTFPKLSTFLSQLKGGLFGEKTNFRKKVSQCRKTERWDRLGVLNTKSVVKIKEIEGGPLERKNFRKKVSQCRKTERGTLWDFSTSILSLNIKKLKGKIFILGKNLTVPKKIERGTLWSRPVCCYAEKQEKPFWFSSLGQMVQFGAIIFCRTFKNYFGQFVWIEKSHANSRVSLHEAPTKNVN